MRIFTYLSFETVYEICNQFFYVYFKYQKNTHLDSPYINSTRTYLRTNTHSNPAQWLTSINRIKTTALIGRGERDFNEDEKKWEESMFLHMDYRGV